MYSFYATICYLDCVEAFCLTAILVDLKESLH